MTHQKITTMTKKTGLPFTPHTLLKQSLLLQPAVDPTGRWIVYVRRTIEGNRYRERIWRLPVSGGEPVCLAQMGCWCAQPRFSPDGGLILFISDCEGTTAPYIMDAEGGGVRRVGSYPGQVRAAEWLADGKKIAVLAPSGVERFRADPGIGEPTARVIRDLNWRRDGLGIRDQFVSLWVTGVGGGEPCRLTDPSFEVSGVFPSPDGQIAILADLTEGAGIRELPRAHLADATTGSVTPLASLAGNIETLGWSPAGRLGLVGIDAANAPGYAASSLFVVHPTGALCQLGTELDRPTRNLINNDISIAYTPATVLWTDEEHIVSHVTNEGYAQAVCFGLDGTIRQLTPDESIVGTIAQGGGRLVAVAMDLSNHSGAAPAAELCAIEGGQLHPLTSHGSAWLASCIRMAETHTVTARGGNKVKAWFLRGRGVKGAGPCVLEIHGGAPGSMRSPFPTSTHLALADAGFNVIWAEPRGSGGFGQAHCPGDAISWEPAFNDLVDVVHWAIESELAKPGHIGVTGPSYGGFMSTWLLGRQPDLFAAGVIEVPLTDMVAGFMSADMYCHGDLAFPRDFELMLSLSPYRWIGETNAAVMLVASDNDLRTPPFQIDLVFDILRRAGKTVEMVRYPGESHTMFNSGRPDRRVDRLERMAAWFRRHLMEATK